MTAIAARIALARSRPAGCLWCWLPLLLAGTLAPPALAVQAGADAVEEVETGNTETTGGTDETVDTATTPAEAALAAFDPGVTPAYEFNKPLWVYYETKRQKARKGSYGWLWGLSDGHFFIERAGRGGKNATPKRKWQVFDYDEINGVLADEKGSGYAFKFDPNIHSWKNIYTSTVGKNSFRTSLDVDTVYEDLERAAKAERDQLIAVEEVAPEAAAPPAPRPAAPAPAPDAPEPVDEPAAGEAVDQLKALPDMYKWAIGIGAVLVILFFVRR